MAATDFNVNFTPTASPVNQQADIFANLDKGYAGAIDAQTKVPDLITNYNNQFGVPQLQKQIQTGQEAYDALGNTISNIPTDIAQRSQESILTQGQKDRQVQAESAPLLKQQGVLGQTIARQQTNLGTAQTNAGQMVTAEQAQQTKELQPWLQKYSDESILSSMRMTGWTQENSQELQTLLANQQAGITLSEGDKNRANALALKEADFEDQLKLNSQQASLTPKNNYIAAGAGTSIFDPSTNSFVATAPYKPTASAPSYTPNFGTTSSANNISSLWNS